MAKGVGSLWRGNLSILPHFLPGALNCTPSDVLIVLPPTQIHQLMQSCYCSVLEMNESFGRGLGNWPAI